MDEDEYNNLVDQLGFTEDEPLIEFEDALNHQAHRRHLASLEAAWLDAGGDPFDSPGEQNIFDDDVHATLFDKNGAVMIGSRIYMHLPGGDVIEFCSCERYM